MKDVEAIIDRDIDPHNRVQVGVLMAEIGDCRMPLHVTVVPKRRRAPARQRQHGYYRAVVLPIARMWLNETQGGMDDGTGGAREFTSDEAHRWLKDALIGKAVHGPDGVYVGTVSPSCGRMSTMQMFHFTDLVIELLEKFGVPVPPPDPAVARSERTGDE